jgi:NAD(P)-dependent dehydrogenase (short-subunit alcohol dehydrogenase family)
MRQAGRHVVVTGAGTGIGRAIALRFAEEGAALSLVARTLERLESTAIDAKTRGAPAAAAYSCDVRDRAAVDRTFEALVRAGGPIHVLVANAGIGGPNAAPSGADDVARSPAAADRFDDLVATNLVGTYSCLRAAERHLAPGPAPRHLVATSSILGRFGVPGYTGYCASKTGLLGLVRALALELAPKNVQVNAICPGWVETDMAREGLENFARALGTDLPGARAEALKAVPLGRMSRPEDVAGLVAWLVSEDAVGVTGQALDMNGGAWMG